MDIETMADTARQLASDLFSTEELPCSELKHGNPSCLQAEEKRPLTKQEKADGWVLRPFFAYSDERMCSSCRAYFHAELAAQELHKIRCNRQKTGGRLKSS